MSGGRRRRDLTVIERGGIRPQQTAVVNTRVRRDQRPRELLQVATTHVVCCACTGSWVRSPSSPPGRCLRTACTRVPGQPAHVSRVPGHRPRSLLWLAVAGGVQGERAEELITGEASSTTRATRPVPRASKRAVPSCSPQRHPTAPMSRGSFGRHLGVVAEAARRRDARQEEMAWRWERAAGRRWRRAW